MASCHRYDFTGDANAMLQFSHDTLDCDTVFVPFGSATIACKVYNPSNKDLYFDEVLLVQGEASPFRVNIDGGAGSIVRNVRLARKDSLYIFVEVKPNRQLLLSDAVVFVVDGAELRSRLQIMAYGQDVVLFSRDTILPDNFIFTAEKPYVFSGNVTVDTGLNAVAEAGAQIFFGNKCGLTVHGTFSAHGTPTQRCTLAYIRTREAWYADKVAQWSGITISPTGNASISGALVRNADDAFNVVDTLQEVSHTQLTLSSTLIEYADIGIHLRGGSARVDNCLVTDCATNAMLAEGGTGNFYRCTFTAKHGPELYNGTLVALQNFCIIERTKIDIDTIAIPLAAYFGDCIAYANNVNEVAVREQKQPSMNFKFDYCLIKHGASFNTSNGERFVGIINKSPGFKNAVKRDFHLQADAPGGAAAIDAGGSNEATLYPIDLDGNDRNALRDRSLGCYAYVH